MRRSMPGWQVGVLATAAAAGLLIVASSATARGTDLRAGTRPDLPSLIRAAEQRGDATQEQVDRLRADLAHATQSQQALDPQLVDQVHSLEAAAGAAELTGPGLRVSLDDAPTDRQARPAGLGPDDFVVHQQDVQGVVNAMWRGGAEGIQVMDQRLLSTDAVRCVGNTLILGGRVYSPPYVITAVGDPRRLGAALANEPNVVLFRDYVDIAGLGYAEKPLDRVTLPAAPLSGMTFARVAS